MSSSATQPNLAALRAWPLHLSPPIPRHFAGLPLHSPSRTVALAPLNSHHVPPIFETFSSVPLVYSRDYNVLPKLSRRFNLSPAQLLSFLVVFVVFVIQLLRDPVPLTQDAQQSSEPPTKADWFTPANTNIFREPLPVSHPDKMTLLEEAKTVAAKFEYPAEDVRKGVKAFIDQMGAVTPRISSGGTSKC